jgi:DNA-binding NtrC family response regulator
MPSILVVDDDPGARDYLTVTLRRSGHTVRAAESGLEALLSIEARLPDLVVSDLRMPGLDGMQLLEHVSLRWPGLPVVILTVSQDVAQVVTAVRLGAADYLLKPSSPEVVAAVVRRSLAARPPASPRDAATEIVGASRAIVEVRALVAFAARSELNVLIVGETGTGKELVARTIHRAGSRAGSFVAHNCAATPAELFDSQFFGYCRGAFTGADRNQEGLLDLADGGLLFLDELESMPLAHQPKLLRVLDDGEFRPVGSTRSRRVSVRVLAALNREPAQAIEDGSLRRDLYYRLRGIEIRLPSLAERREDIPLLAARFLGQSSGRLTPAAACALEEHAWPGNVRELRDVVRSARERAGTGPILAEHVTPAWRAGPGVCGLGSEGASLREAERELVLRTLAESGGNRSRAARVLGVDRSTLWRKLNRMQRDRGARDREGKV